MNFKPLYDRVLVKKATVENKTVGGIYIPDTAQKKTPKGEVVAIGPTAKDVKVGDKVIFSEYAGTEITVDGVECLVMKEADIIGVVE